MTPRHVSYDGRVTGKWTDQASLMPFYRSLPG
jgi:hypothetical protein